MAYARYARRRRSTRRVPRRTVRRTVPRYRRRSTRYRRTRTRRRPAMSVRRINDITSTKKRDNMLTFSNVTVPRNPPPVLSSSAAILQGGFSNYNFLFAPSAREKAVNSTTSGTVLDESTRTTTNTYVKGYRERISMQTNSALPWTWRRIVFTLKGTANFLGSGNPLFLLTSNGHARVITELSAPQQTTIESIMFDGQKGLDWRSTLEAKVDTSLITVMSDTTKIITPQTSAGSVKNYTLYYPINKSLQYAEDEFGGQTLTSPWSTQGKPGMGDLLVYDIFTPRAASATTDQLTLDIQATYYWHEK